MVISSGLAGNRHAVDQGWNLQVGPVRFQRWHRSYVHNDWSSLPSNRKRSPTFSARAALGGGLLSLGVLAATNLMTGQARAKPGYAITIPVPPSIKRLPTPRLTTEPAIIARRPPIGVAKSRLQRRDPVSAGPPPTLSSAAYDEPLASPPPATLATAQKRALATGEIQDWRDPANGIYGFVVAGPLTQEDGQSCRAMTVLTRSADGDNVTEQRRCR